jgi:hypothetical protein
MDHQKLKQFIEQEYCMVYNPHHIIPQLHKNTEYHKYFMYRPYASGLLQTEFYYDVKKKKFMRYTQQSGWDPMMDDTFS